jgi:hypothetical protein
MPGAKRGGRGRSAIYAWRVKAGNREVFSFPVKGKCEDFIRRAGGKLGGVKLRLVAPNLQGSWGPSPLRSMTL